MAIVAHHPQAVYFGMKSGFIPKEKAPDELIKGTEKDPAAPARPRSSRPLPGEASRRWAQGYHLGRPAPLSALSLVDARARSLR